MKRFIISLVILALCVFTASSQYLQTTVEYASTPSDDPSWGWCTNGTSRSLTFDLEPIGGSAYLDLALGKAFRNSSGNVVVRCQQDYNSASTPSFPSSNGTFSEAIGVCDNSLLISNFIFGKLRPWLTRRDLAVTRQNGTELYHNTGSGMQYGAVQTLSGAGIDGTWGPFNYADTYEDLAVTSGSDVKIYRNLNNGYVDSNPYTFSISATKIILAQIDRSSTDPVYNTNWDLVSFNGSTLSIRLNNRSNGFNTPQDITMPGTIYSIAVGDINNDNFNDIVVGLESYEARLYLNQNGVINSSPTWSVSGYPIPYRTQVLIGDLGSPGDGTRNDGWNDVLVTGYEGAVRVFINQKSGSFFTSSPQQQFYAGFPYGSTGKVMLGDVQNTGGLSFLLTQFVSPIGNPSYAYIALSKHTGNPAPAPPKNTQMSSYVDDWGYRYPQISWASNTERDINGYEIWRRVTGICGNGVWYLLDGDLTASTLEYIDWSIGTVVNGGDCRAYYYVKAKDVAGGASDSSKNVFADYGSSQWKRAEGGSGELVAQVPDHYALHAAYPNPFNPSTQIKFDLPEDGFVTLNVFDVLGRTVGELVNGNYAAGYHTATWNAANVSSGVYFVRFTATDGAGALKFKKMIKLILNK